MNTRKDKLKAIVSPNSNNSLERSKNRIRSREMLREARKIALKVLIRLDELQWTQKYLAERLEVSPQQVNKIVKGKENLTLETQVKLQNVLQIPILASFYEEKVLINTSSFNIKPLSVRAEYGIYSLALTGQIQNGIVAEPESHYGLAKKLDEQAYLTEVDTSWKLTG